MATDGERLATLEQVARDIHEDLGGWAHEQERTRMRLHDLEATVRGLTIAAKIAEESTERRQRALEIRMQVLTVVLAAAAVLEPFFYHLANH